MIEHGALQQSVILRLTNLFGVKHAYSMSQLTGTSMPCLTLEKEIKEKKPILTSLKRSKWPIGRNKRLHAEGNHQD